MTTAQDQPQVLLPESDEFRLSYSAITTHRRCPQAWVYQYLLGLVPDIELSPTDRVKRDYGGWWHAVRAADTIRRGRMADSLISTPGRLTTGDDGPVLLLENSGMLKIRGSSTPPLPLSSDTVIQIAKAWWSKAGETVREAWESEIGTSLPDALIKMDRRWRDTWAEDTKYERPLMVEVQGTRALPGLEGEELVVGREGEIPPPVLRGQVDEVYLDTRRNIVVVRDTKSMGDIPIKSAIDDLLDSQLHLYVWIVEPALAGYGLKPQAVQYDRARTKNPSTPAITQTGTLSKSVTDYDLTTYLEFVGEGVTWGEEDVFYKTGAKKGQPKWGVYTPEDKVIEQLSTPAIRAKWNQRTLTPLNRNVLDAHLSAAVETYRDMWRTVERNKVNRQVARNMGKHCSWCDYLSLCAAQVLGGPDGEYTLADHGLKQS